MKHAILALFAVVLLRSFAFAAPQGDVMTPIRQFIDGFNNGDTKSALAAYASGDTSSLDWSTRRPGLGCSLRQTCTGDGRL